MKYQTTEENYVLPFQFLYCNIFITLNESLILNVCIKNVANQLFVNFNPDPDPKNPNLYQIFDP